MTMAQRGRWLILRICAALLSLAAPGAVAAQQEPTVTYRTAQGAVLATGGLIRRDADYARIRTADGPVTLSLDGLICEGPGCAPGPPVLHIAGSDHIARVLMPALIQSYARATGANVSTEVSDPDGVTFRLTQPIGAQLIRLSRMPEELALQRQAAGEVDLVIAAHAPDDVSVQRLRVLALDALVPAVARDTPLTTITLADLRRILEGDIRDWSELGVADGGPIEVFHTAPRSDLAGLLPSEPPAGARVPQADRPLGAQVAMRSGAFGLLPLSQLARAKPLSLSGICGRPVPATPARLKAEDYPLATPLLLILPEGRLPGSAFDFLSFLRSPSAQLVVRRAGYVDQLPERIPLHAQGQRIANALLAAGQTDAAPLSEAQDMLAYLAGAERLTITFRFDDGGAVLDAQSAGNVPHLAEMIDSGRISGSAVLLVGFSDGSGPAAANRALSEARADTVRRAVEDAVRTLHPGALPMRLEVRGFGEALPIGCDDTPWGRQMNRRVEVWVRP